MSRLVQDICSVQTGLNAIEVEDMSKTHFIFVDDHSGSMDHLVNAAIADKNAIISTVVEEASAKKLNTVVSVVQVGVASCNAFAVPAKAEALATTRTYRSDWPNVLHWSANPHVLAPVTKWPTPGQTPLWDGITLGVLSALAAPDAQGPDQAFVLFVTTDGEDNASRVPPESLRRLLAEVSASGNWTFAFRVPRGKERMLDCLSLPQGAVQVWDTTVQGMASSTKVSKAAVSSYMASRASGVRGSNAFYAQAAGISRSGLTEINPGAYSLYVVGQDEMGKEILPFILSKRMSMHIGAAFYQLTKTEARVTPDKKFVLREKKTGKVFEGDVRAALGLPTVSNVRLHPGDHGEWDIFIQSHSTNRQLVAGTGVLYIPAYGERPVTEADVQKYAKKPQATSQGAPVKLADVPPTSRPTPSPVKAATTPAAPAKVWAKTRQDARKEARRTQQRVVDHGPTAPAGQRWEVVKRT
jgi:hypothetical protein